MTGPRRGRRGLPAALVLLAVGGLGCDDEPARQPPPIDMAPLPDVAAPDMLTPDMAPAARIWFVAHDAAGGDGSQRAPFARPDDAYAVARPGDLVILLPGRHPTPPLPPAGVELLGSGSRVTTVEGPMVVDRSVTLGAMTIDGGDPPLHITAEGRATIDEVRVSGAVSLVIRVDGALEGRDLSAVGSPALQVGVDAAVDVRGGALQGIDSAAVVSSGQLRLDTVGISADGDGVRVEGGEAVLDTPLIDGVAVGVRVLDGEAIVRGGLIRGAAEPGGTGAGVRVMGGMVRVEDVRITESDRGVRVDPQGTLDLQGCVVREPATDGLSIQGGRATGSGLTVVNPGNVGLAVLDDGAAELTNVSINGAARAGVLCDGARLVADGLVVQAARARGITLSRSSVELDGVVVFQAGDVCLQITDPIERVAVRDGTFEACVGSGVAVFGGGGEVVLQSLVVQGTTVGDGGLAEGVHLFRTRAELTGITSLDNAGAGVLFEQAAGFVRGGALSGNVDPGLVVLEPPTPVEGSMLLLEGNGGAGALVVAGELQITDSMALRTTISLDVALGHGFYATAGGRLVVQGGQAWENAGSGVAFDPATTGAVGASELFDNRGYGLDASCGAMVEEPEANSFRGNALGDRAACDP